MFALKIFVFLVLLGCGMSFVMPDIEQDSMKLELASKRDQKRLDLLKSLEEFSSEVHQVIPTVKLNSHFLAKTCHTISDREKLFQQNKEEMR
ncbi:hypothetical protein CDAR_399001 [Caerostris darwini]|uniref:Uncharacterized protein n=1 Tax=Caerostris darwini TaxID=1538125 RepID=A0AAV4VY36_9ARAC|nr:hypothetical protein CDAR_399001 [Caerostris darwini]